MRLSDDSSVRLPERERRDRVTRFLARHGTTPDDVLPYISNAFGSPLFVVATGSIPAGYGNDRSDSDLYVVVPEPKVSQLPIVAVDRDLRVDVRYFPAADLESFPRQLDGAWPEPGQAVSRRAFNDRRAVLETAVRFAVGVTLVADPVWDDWKRALEGPALREAAIRWWALETRRRLVAARWLHDGSLACAYRYVAALTSALHDEVSRHGHLFFGSKWLHEKLLAVADPAMLGLFEQSFAHPMTEGTRQAIDELAARVGSADVALEAQLYLAPGCRVDRMLGRTLLSRWQLRGVELEGDNADLADAASTGASVWRGDPATPPPSPVADLFAADFLSLTIGVAGADST